VQFRYASWTQQLWTSAGLLTPILAEPEMSAGPSFSPAYLLPGSIAHSARQPYGPRLIDRSSQSW
jgi:hypothetical protein